MNPFQQLQAKDWITLVASLSAVTFSALSYWQRSSAGKLILRKQLTDAIERLTDINADVAKYHAFSREKRESDFPPNYVSLLNSQRRFIVRQAEFLSRRIRSLVSPYEYLLIASAFDSLNESMRAEEFFRRASDTTEAIDRGIALRTHGRYLFGRGLPDEGRKKFEEALIAFAGESDHFRICRGHTFERWATQESERGDPECCGRLLGNAVREYTSIENPSRRGHEIGRVTPQLPETQPAYSGEQRIGTPP
jgi:hypothetical protein